MKIRINSRDFTYLLISSGIPDGIYHILDIVDSFFTRFDAGRFMMRAISEFSSSSAESLRTLLLRSSSMLAVFEDTGESRDVNYFAIFANCDCDCEFSIIFEQSII
jgi:hypothetical protein